MAVKKEDPEATATEHHPLPKGYTPMLDILDNKVQMGLHNVGGLVRSCLLPTKCRGGDFKMTLELIDKSLEPSLSSLKIHIFKENEADMPKVHSSDVVLIRQAKMQTRDWGTSLLSNRGSKIFVYSAGKIPPAPKPAQEALDRSLKDAQTTSPTGEEHQFASWLFHNVDHETIPQPDEFKVQAKQSLHVREKFGLLKDVACNMFYNFIVRVEHTPHASNDAMNIWVSDYTSNPLFQDFEKPGSGTSTGDAQPGDPYAYMNTYAAKSANKQLVDWKGPLGKMSMQVSCFGKNSAYIANYVQMGHWLELKNVRVRMGRNGVYLEGIMYEDTEYHSPLRVSHVQTDNIDTIDPRYKDALRRMRDYQKQQKYNPAMKRKMEDLLKEDLLKEDKKKKKKSQRRKVTRTAKSKEHEQKSMDGGNGGNGDRNRDDAAAAAAVEEPPAVSLVPLAPHVNDNVVSEYQDQPITLLADILAPVYWKKPKVGEDVAAEKSMQLDRLPDKIPLPFVNLNFRAQVRVVDFLPSRLTDFAVGRQQSELDILSDNENDDVASSDDEDLQGVHEANIVWEWRFALLLEEATPVRDEQANSQTPARLWAMVDNTEAQMLTGLTACNLNTHPEELDTLRETLFVLWGNLEEKKRQQLREQREAAVAAAKAAAGAKAAAAKKRQLAAQKARQGQTAPVDSSDDEWLPQAKPKGPPSVQNSDSQQVSNRPFVCCMRQYGVQKRTVKAGGDGSGRKTVWKQTFGLFGTKIRNLPAMEEAGEEVEAEVEVEEP